MIARCRHSGFSLIELIVVIVILGALATGAGLLILKPIESYDAQLRRQQLVDQGEMALRQIARDVRQALPNSLRTRSLAGLQGVEMVNIIDGARYRDEFGGEFVADTDILEFSGNDTDFNFLGTLNNLLPGVINARLVIYNTNSAGIYNDAALNNSPGIITPSTSTLTLSLNTPPSEDAEHHISISAPGFQFSQQSPGQRAFLVDGPVSYLCNPGAGSIVRYSGYAYSTTQPMPPVGGTSDTVISRLGSCNISYTAGSLQRGDILSLEITISDSGEAIKLFHQVHVVNLP